MAERPPPETDLERLGEPAPARTLAGRLARLLLRALGWRMRGPVPTLPRYVLIAAPHTSNWDMPAMLLFGFAYEQPVSFLMKDTVFRGPFDRLFRRLGGIPVKRTVREGTIAQAAARFAERERLVLVVAPDGTRAWSPHWRSGFYRIAEQAGVPIVLGFIDFGRKVGGFGPALAPSGDIHADMRWIAAFYAGMRGKRPELVGPVRVAD